MEEFNSTAIALSVDEVTENGIPNFDVLRTAALEDVSVFRDIVISEDDIDVAPKWRAELNKKAKRISDFRIAFEKDFKKKIEKSVNQLKELSAIYTDTANNIDSQVKQFEQIQKEEKQTNILAIYEEVFADWKDIISISQVESFSDGKWLNKGTSLDAIRKFMEETKKKVENGINSIHGLNSKFDKEMCYAFLNRLDIADALNKKAELERFEQQMLAKKKAEEEKQAEQVQETIQPNIQDNVQDNVQVEPKVEQQQEEQIYRLQFAIYGTKSELKMLTEYIKNSGLRYERI